MEAATPSFPVSHCISLCPSLTLSLSVEVLFMPGRSDAPHGRLHLFLPALCCIPLPLTVTITMVHNSLNYLLKPVFTGSIITTCFLLALNLLCSFCVQVIRTFLSLAKLLHNVWEK